MNYLRNAVFVAFAASLAACGHRPAVVASAPVPAPAPAATPAPERAEPAPQPVDTTSIAMVSRDSADVQDSTAAAADSAADEAALSALDSLELGTLEKGGTRARGTANAPAVTGTNVAGEASAMFSAPRGGTASTAAPTYDIDVETFASHARVQAYVDYFLGPARDRFGIWLGRMARFEGMARDRFRIKGIPEDMVYLGLIESGFSSTAVSRTKAVGMWQFMAGTARLYGLKMDQWVDERRDPYKATDAAARLLSDLNNEFGSWYLAAAAYNAGSGRVSRGLRKINKGGDDSVTDSMFFRLSDKRYLKRETRDYVPKLIAAALIAKDPTRYGFDSFPELPPLVYDEVTVSQQTGLDVIARLADTTTSAVLELNPHLFRGVTPPEREVVVRVPRGTGTAVAQRWAELPASERVTVIDHVVARGETIGGIAKRYHVEQSYIIAANPKLRPRALRIGQRLVIPVSLTARATLGGASHPAAVRRAPRTASAAVTSERYHVVRFGESLWQIAQHYHIKVNDLREWNDLAEGEVIKPGVRLIVVRPGSTADVSVESAR